MSQSLLIENAQVVNEGTTTQGGVLIVDGRIAEVFEGSYAGNSPIAERLDAQGKHLLPGVIDDQVHFREPGLTLKADLTTESRAAVAGGITSFMEMPNTVPQTLTQELLEQKYHRAAEVSVANYSFFMGASNNNLEEVLKTDPQNVCGIKVFMGSSTGNMLVDNRQTLETLFAECPMLIATHCEDEATIRANSARYKEQYGENMPLRYHPEIRSVEACYRSSSMAVELAAKHDTRLHVLHISTGRETALFSNDRPLAEKRITAEVCVHHLWFSDADYDKKGTFIKWNPAVKTAEDREQLWEALRSDRLDILATDHAPHQRVEKENTYFNAPSGGPLVQHFLPAMLDAVHQGRISLERMVEKMSHAPAICFQLAERGFIRPGFWADLVLVDLNSPWTVTPENILYKCGWSPFEGHSFRSQVTHTLVNGQIVYSDGQVNEAVRGQRLSFQRS